MFDTIIHAQDLAQIIDQDNLCIFDCRFFLNDKSKGRKLYDESHIPGASYAHLDNDLSGEIIPNVTGRHPLPKEEDFEKWLQSRCVSNNDQVIVYDQHHGGIAARLWWMMNWVGHKNVAVLNGGWEEWTNLNLPVSSERVQGCMSDFKCHVDVGMVAPLDVVEKYSEERNDNLTDARANTRYHGINEPIDPVGGHIPGADSKQFIDNLTEHKLWKSKDEVGERFADKEDAIMYCGSGVTACHNILAHKYAGLEVPRLYPGSWSEWIIDPKHRVG